MLLTDVGIVLCSVVLKMHAESINSHFFFFWLRYFWTWWVHVCLTHCNSCRPCSWLLISMLLFRLPSALTAPAMMEETASSLSATPGDIPHQTSWSSLRWWLENGRNCRLLDSSSATYHHTDRPLIRHSCEERKHSDKGFFTTWKSNAHKRICYVHK